MKDNRQYPKVLLVSDATWADDNNIGNTFSNLFGDWESNSLAMIYARSDLPNNSLCNNYFQITEKRIIKNLLDKKVKTGIKIKDVERIKNIDDMKAEEQSGNNMYNFFKRYRLNVFMIARNWLWKFGDWKTDELDEFILDFNPDVVFLLAGQESYMNSLQQYIIKKSKVNAVIYFVDDIYSTKFLEFSPLFWIHKFSSRHAIRKTVSMCDKVYTILPKQKDEYDKVLGVKSDVVNKGGDFKSIIPLEPKLNEVLKLIYTGNINIGRWKILAKIGQVLDDINKNEKKAELFIYSQNKLEPDMKKAFEQSESLKFMGGISAEKVKEIQEDGDILVHVESFDLKVRYNARLSFSTKLVDYFERRRCILAIGWGGGSSIDYLIKEDAAVVVDDLDNLETLLKNLLSDRELILEYGRRGWNCGLKKHNIEDIREKVYTDLIELKK